MEIKGPKENRRFLQKSFMNESKLHIKAIAQILSIWALLGLIYYILVNFVWT